MSLVAGIQLKMTKQGNAWAIVNLADRDAGMDRTPNRADWTRRRLGGGPGGRGAGIHQR
ncbi:hypothetical protein [Streptomyces spongiae]|uniref:hypothetical protein n=1 Tax=Streptomyces spongiae TaxID=565072 RepID=UPI00188381BC|nr:hypothetical protein [Streptomyces spongiae]